MDSLYRTRKVLHNFLRVFKTMSNIYDEAFFAKIVNTYHIETSPLICRANQWTSFCMIAVKYFRNKLY